MSEKWTTPISEWTDEEKREFIREHTISRLDSMNRSLSRVRTEMLKELYESGEILRLREGIDQIKLYVKGEPQDVVDCYHNMLESHFKGCALTTRNWTKSKDQFSVHTMDMHIDRFAEQIPKFREEWGNKVDINVWEIRS